MSDWSSDVGSSDLHGIRYLATDLALQERLRANPEMVGDASEEMLRRFTFTVPPRVIGKDATFNGVEMKKGERAMLFLPAADLDPKAFAQPDSRTEERRVGKEGVRTCGSRVARDK